MADIPLSRQRQLELEAQAEADAEFELSQQAEPLTSQSVEPSLTDRVWSGIKDIPGALYEGGKQALKTGQQIYEGYNPLESGPQNLYRGATNLYEAAKRNPAAAIRTAATLPAMAASPVLAPAFATGLNYLGGKAAQYLGYEDPTSGGEDLQQATTTLGMAGLPVVAAKGLGKAIESLPTRSAAAELYKASNKEGILTALQDAPKGTTNAERAFARGTVEYEPEFQARNPFQGLDPSNPLEAMKGYRGNLSKLVTEGVENKKTILKDIALKESAQKAALSKTGQAVDSEAYLALRESDLDFSTLNKLKENATDSQMAGVEAAKNELIKEFYEPKVVLDQNSRYVASDIPDLARPRVRSITEFDETLKRIDAKISELGGYDDSYLASIGQNPSTIDAQVRALRVARRTLADGIKNYASRNFGENVAAALGKANDDIAVGTRYGELAKRFDTQTLEIFTPGSGRSMNTAVSRVPSRIEDAARIIISGRSKRAEQFRQGNLRPANMIRDSQRIINWRNGAPPPLLSRDWDLVKTNPASFSLLSTLLATAGVDPSIVQRMPDQEQKRTFTKIIESFPEAFEAPEGGYFSYANGKLNSPLDQSAHLEAALGSKFDFSKEAAVVAPLLERGEYVPLDSPSMAQQSQQKSSVDLSQILQGLSSYSANSPSASNYFNPPEVTNETSKLIEQMRKSQTQIDATRSGL